MAHNVAWTAPQRVPAGMGTDQMQTLGSALDDQKGFGRAFDFLRIVLASGIIAWHTAQLSGHLEIARASVFWFSEYVLVPMFFALSGFLVAGSSERLSVKDFLLNRGARIVPALAVDVLFAALLIGPLVTTLPVSQYFTDPGFFGYFLNISGWIHYELPGVFTANPSNEVNGALWTVPLEIICYLIIVGLMVVGAIKRPGWVPLMTGVVLIAQVPLRVVASRFVSDDPTTSEIVLTNLFLHRGSLLWPSFLIGISIYQLRYYLPYSRMVAVGLVGAGILLSAFGSHAELFSNAGVGHAFAHSIILLLLAYLTVLVGLSPMPRLPGFGSGDYSYGLYLYHVPFLQLLIYCFPAAWTGEGWWTLFLAGFPLSLLAAVISWHLFEYPVLKFRNSFRVKHAPVHGAAAIGLSPEPFRQALRFGDGKVSSPT
jgi:peptidoglycan/LPS O-acetylase OafA/YrhL